MTRDSKAIGARLRGMRVEHGLSQDDVARYLELDPATVSNYELGKTDISYVDVWKLSDLYGVTMDELVGRLTGGVR